MILDQSDASSVALHALVTSQRNQRFPILFRVLSFSSSISKPSRALLRGRSVIIALGRRPFSRGIVALRLAAVFYKCALFAQTLLRPPLIGQRPEGHNGALELRPAPGSDAQHSCEAGVIIRQRAVARAPRNHHQLEIRPMLLEREVPGVCQISIAKQWHGWRITAQSRASIHWPICAAQPRASRWISEPVKRITGMSLAANQRSRRLSRSTCCSLLWNSLPSHSTISLRV